MPLSLVAAYAIIPPVWWSVYTSETDCKYTFALVVSPLPSKYGDQVIHHLETSNVVSAEH